MKKSAAEWNRQYEARWAEITKAVNNMAIGEFKFAGGGQSYLVVPNTRHNRRQLRMLKSRCFSIMRLFWYKEGTWLGHEPREKTPYLWVVYYQAYTL